MEIALADQHIFILEDRLSPDDIRQRAMDRRSGAFGSGLGNLLQRPKADDIEFLNSQHRLEPFWHVGGHALTGQMRQGQALMSKVQRVVTRDALFDIGADTVGLLVPGGGIAVKVAKLAIEKRQKA